MQNKNAITGYTAIENSGDYIYECMVEIDGVEYGENVIWNMETHRNLFTEDNPMIGCATAGEIDIEMSIPDVEFPRAAVIKPYVRLKGADTNRYSSAIVGICRAGLAVVGTMESVVYSGWVQKGEYYIDTREKNTDIGTITIHGFDAMLKAEADYPSSTRTWSNNGPIARYVLDDIASAMGVSLDTRTTNAIRYYDYSYVVSFPAQYTMREMLCTIAAMYGGNFCMSDTGELLFVGLYNLPEESYYLIQEAGNYITFGGTRILLRSD